MTRLREPTEAASQARCASERGSGVSVIRVLLAGGLALLALSGCGSSATSSPDPTTTVASSNDPICAARTDLTASVRALTTPSLLTEGKPAIQAALDEVKTDLDALSTAAKDVYGPEIEAVQAAVADVGAALSNVGDGNASENQRAIRDAAADVGSTTSHLIATSEGDCG